MPRIGYSAMGSAYGRTLAGDAVGLRGLEAPGARERPQHAPGAARGEEPVGLAPERPPELRAERRPRGGDGGRGGERDAEHEPRGVRGEPVREVPAEEAEHGIDGGGDGPLDHLVADVA